MKHLVLLMFLTGSSIYQDYETEIRKWQQELNDSFRDSEESPLEAKEFKRFEGLDFYPIDRKYRIEADFLRTPEALPFKMSTTTDRLPVYVKYGEAIFELDGKPIRLPVYQSMRMMNTDDGSNYLFLPFTDETNGTLTYGGGRYLDLEIPDSAKIVIDFNKAYNPYCAYNARYSCPIPPRENHIPLSIEAGVRNETK